MENIYHSRFKDAIWHSYQKEVTIGGAGGIGSWLALYLSRIGIDMRIFDFDTIDFTNLGGQLYPENAIGEAKVTAVSNVVRQFSGNKVRVKDCGKLDLTTPDDENILPLTFACFDSIAARKALFEKWLSMYNMKRFDRPAMFFDGRMTAESFQIYCVAPKDADKYRLTLFDDGLIPDLPCSLKATSHIGGHIGAMLTEFFTNFLTNQKQGRDERTVPFKYIYEAPLCYTQRQL